MVYGFFSGVSKWEGLGGFVNFQGIDGKVYVGVEVSYFKEGVVCYGVYYLVVVVIVLYIFIIEMFYCKGEGY